MKTRPETPKYPLRPDVATIALNHLSAKLADVQTPDQLTGLKTASIAAGQKAIADWKTACQLVTNERHRIAGHLRDFAAESRGDAAALVKQADDYEAEADSLEKGIMQNG